MDQDTNKTASPKEESQGAGSLRSPDASRQVRENIIGAHQTASAIYRGLTSWRIGRQRDQLRNLMGMLETAVGLLPEEAAPASVRPLAEPSNSSNSSIRSQPQGEGAPAQIAAEVSISAEPVSGVLATATLIIRGTKVPGFRVMRGRYGLFVAFPLATGLLRNRTIAEHRRYSEIILDAYRAAPSLVGEGAGK
jgi:hypothetical protein